MYTKGNEKRNNWRNNLIVFHSKNKATSLDHWKEAHIITFSEASCQPQMTSLSFFPTHFLGRQRSLGSYFFLTSRLSTTLCHPSCQLVELV